MAALVGPPGCGGARGAGYQKDDIPRLGVGARALRPAIGREKLEEFLRNGTDAGIRTRDFALVSAAEHRYAYGDTRLGTLE